MADRKNRKRRDAQRREEGRAKLLKQVRRRFSEHATQTARRARRGRP